MVIGRYTPGTWQAAVTERGIALLGPEVPVALLERVWQEADAGRGLPAVLEALTGAFGTSLAAIPPFAVLLREGSALRAVVRGALELQVDTPDGVEVMSGAGVTTWNERIIADARRVTVVSPEAPAPGGDYPVRDGIVLVSSITVDFTDAGTPTPVVARTPAARASEEEPAQEPVPEPEPEPEPEAAPEPEPEAAPEPEPAPPAAPPALIDSAAVLTMATADTLSPADSTWDATIVASVGGDRPSAPGDHDGATISVAEARALRTAPVDSTPPPLAPPRPPAPGRIQLSTGQELLLDRTVVIGRRPRSTRVVGTDLPHLVAVESPEQDISRSHIELRAEGDSVLVTDLHTTNGTTLHRAGADPVRLHPGEPTVLVPSDLLDLGDGVTVTILELE